MNFPTGVELHNGKIRITFTYRGKRCREVLRGWTVNSSNIKKPEIFARSSQVKYSSVNSTMRNVSRNPKRLRSSSQPKKSPRLKN